MQQPGRKLPTDAQRFVNLLDTPLEKVDTKTWHQVDRTEKEDSEVVEEFGGPCRGRTYGPLIKSRIRAIYKGLIGQRFPRSFVISGACNFSMDSIESTESVISGLSITHYHSEGTPTFYQKSSMKPDLDPTETSLPPSSALRSIS